LHFCFDARPRSVAWHTLPVEPVSHRIDESEWLIADIGGTHARLACWQRSSGITRIVRLANDDLASPAALIGHYVVQSGCSAKRALLALAMPLDGDTMMLTNRAWSFAAGPLLAALGWTELRLVNDFSAAAAGVESLPLDAFALLCGDNAVLEDTRLVLGPGTGLGAAAVIATTAPTRIVASEAGHMTLAPSGAGLLLLARSAHAQWGRASWERILCGSGLAWIDAQLRAIEAPLSPAEVAARAQRGERTAVDAVTNFSRLLGEFAGDLCLAFTAFGAVTLCGGVLDGLGAAFDDEAFCSGFTEKGRFSARLARVPRRRATGYDLGLLGLAHYLSGACEMPVITARR
jgi:glucokinase